MVILRTSYGRSGIRCHASFITRQRHRTGGKVTVKQLTMKRVLFFAALCCAMLFQTLNAQDIIFTKQSTRIDAKILEVSATEVRYKKTSNPDGPTFVMSTSEISSILYANGEVQHISEMQQPLTQPQNDNKSTKNGSFVLYQKSSAIVSEESYPYEISGLEKMIGTVKYEEYKAAQKHFKRGDWAVSFGWVDMFTGGLLIFWSMAKGDFINQFFPGIEDYRHHFLSVGGLLLVASDVLLPVGYIVKGVNAGRISRIAEGYNATHNKGTELSLSMSPTLMNNHGQIAPGVGLTLRF